MRHYLSFSEYCQNRFGHKVYKLSLSGGMTCPNRDGTLGTRGCSFCSASGSGEFASDAHLPIPQQLERAKSAVSAKIRDGAYIAYFQPFSNTYADPAFLRRIFFEAIAPDDIVALSVATRPDCLPDKVIDLLSELNGHKPVIVELGLQTIHEPTARAIRRGYPLAVYDDAVRRLHERGIEVVTHLILGLPGESREMMLASVSYVGARTDGIKLQLLHVIDGTDLADDYRAGLFETLSLEAYTDLLCDAIEHLPEHIVIHRLTGDGAKRSLIAPLWSADKKRVLNYINRTLDERGIIQGSKLK